LGGEALGGGNRKEGTAERDLAREGGDRKERAWDGVGERTGKHGRRENVVSEAIVGG